MIPTKFSTRDVPAALRREVVEAAYGMHVPNSIDFLHDAPVAAEMVMRQLGDSHVAFVETSPVRLTTPPDDTGMLYIGVTERGGGVIGANDDAVCVRPGDVRLLRRERKCVTIVSEPSAVLSIAVPREPVLDRIGNSDRLSMPLSLQSPAARMLRSYALHLLADATAFTADEQAVFSSHIVDLAALMLGARGDGGEQARRRGGRAARREMVHADIRRHLGESDLSIDQVAKRQGVSPAYVRALFYDQGTSFTEFVQDERLAHVDRLLCDPSFDRHNIASLALLAGFGDISWFNQLFRRRFEMTPSQRRADRRFAVAAE